MHRTIIFTLFLFISSCFLGQEVISTSGNAYNSGGVHLYWTIGETVIATEDDGNTIITQGFHQPQVTISTVEEKISTEFSIYPNPTQNFFTIQATSITNTSAYITDLNGKIIQSFQLKGLTTSINIESFSSGIYLLTIVENQMSNTYKIIKK